MLALLRPKGRPYVVGHRGARGHAPENTMAGFARGAELGADLVECDVHMSADGRAIVIHDETVDRTTNGHGRVRDLRAADLARLDAGGGQHVPTLDELAAWLAGRSAPGLVVEIKNGAAGHPTLAATVVSCLDAHGLLDRAIVIGFDPVVVEAVKGLSSGLATGLLYRDPLPDPVAAARAARADSLWPRTTLLTPELASSAHGSGLAVFTWTANSPQEMDGAIAAGADGVGSDYPDVLARRIQADR